MPSLPLLQRLTLDRVALRVSLSVAAALLACPAFAQDGQAPEKEKPKAAANKTADKPQRDKTPEIEASRFCANAARRSPKRASPGRRNSSAISTRRSSNGSSISKKRRRRVQEWVAKRDAMLKAASDNLVAIYAKMRPETAATQIAAMDDQMAAAILRKLKPGAAGAILNEMEAERASKLATFSRARRTRRRNLDAAASAAAFCWRSPCR